MKDKTQSKGSFLKGAVLIAAGGFLAKIIGALYRIPLTNLIGGHGIGLYQLVYPVYCLLLTVSATGIPSSIAKLTAEKLGRGESDKPLFSAALKLFLIIGFFGALLMAALAPLLAAAQGSKEVLGGYFTLAPSVFLVSAISVLRGFFQGRNDMFPTAVSEVIEQAVKVAFGLFFAYIFREDIPKAVVFLLLSVSLSELVALLVMIALYRLSSARKETGKDGGRVAFKTILHTSIPVTLSALLIPFSSLVDSVVAVRLLGKYAADSVALFGLFAGGAVTVVNLPVSICYGIAAASIPALAAAKAKAEQESENGAEKRPSVRKKLFFSLGITVLVSLPAAIGLYHFAEPVSRMIYRNLTGEELQTLVSLIKAFSISAFTLSCTQTLSACLTAQGKPQYAAISMAIAMTVKTAVYCFLLQKAEISVFGLAYATNIGYSVAFFLNFVYNLRVSKRKRSKANDNGSRIRE